MEGQKTAYAAFFFLPEEKRWKHLATFRTTTKGSPLKGYYSFVEDFRRDTRSVAETRRAHFRNGWAKTLEGDWIALTKARFSASQATWEAKENIDGGLQADGFFLATGGYIAASTALGATLSRPQEPRKPPTDLPEG